MRRYPAVSKVRPQPPHSRIGRSLFSTGAMSYLYHRPARAPQLSRANRAIDRPRGLSAPSATPSPESTPRAKVQDMGGDHRRAPLFNEDHDNFVARRMRNCQISRSGPSAKSAIREDKDGRSYTEVKNLDDSNGSESSFEMILFTLAKCVKAIIFLTEKLCDGGGRARSRLLSNRSARHLGGDVLVRRRGGFSTAAREEGVDSWED